MKKLILSVLFLLSLSLIQSTLAQETQAQEYVTLNVILTASTTIGSIYVIAYSDGKTEKGELKPQTIKNLEFNVTTINGILNTLAKKGYKLISSTGTEGYSNYIFEK